MKDKGFIPRIADKVLSRLQKGFPVIGIIGPRQAGKTTLAKAFFSEKPYVSLENPDQLDFAQADPRRFLNQFKKGAIIDEAQRCPTLFSYLQGIVDEDQQMGQFILTGSQQFGFRAKISQTLAGRIAIINLLPFSYIELHQHGYQHDSIDELLFQGLYPPLYTRTVTPSDWYASYVATYLERDVQQIIKVKDLNIFRTFLRLCAGRAGQLLNLSEIGNEVGVSYNTIKEWISVLEASFIIYRLQPHHNNFSKRLIKTPKLYFFDTGLLCWLIGIKQPEQLSTHVMRGAIFENFIATEFMKSAYSTGSTPNIYFWRDKSGLEIDLIYDQAGHLFPIEIKSGATITNDYFKGLNKFLMLSNIKNKDASLIYGGDADQARSIATVYSWRNMQSLFDKTTELPF